MTHTLRTRLLLWFIVFSFLSVLVVIILNTAYFRAREKVSNAIAEINDLQTSFLQDFKTLNRFFSLDVNSNEFFQTHKSTNLEDHFKNSIKIKSEIIRLSAQETSESLEVVNNYSTLKDKTTEYEVMLSQLIDLILERGFKDDGVVGEMRNSAHILEHYPEIDLIVILTLRRHEKDYMIRNEQVYINSLRQLGNKYRSDILENESLTKLKRDTILAILDNYLLNFNKIVILDEKIGIRSSGGMRKLLDNKEQEIMGTLNDMLAVSNLAKNEIFTRMEKYYFIYFLMIFILSVVVSIYISDRITSPLSTLTEHIQQLIASDFKLKGKPVFKKAHYEIEVLYAEFYKMITQLDIRDKERDEAENALRLNELKFRQLSEMLPQSVFETNEIGNFTYVNKTWIETFGYSIDDINEGLNLIEVLKSDSGFSSQDRKETDFKEFIAIRKDKQSFPAIVYSNPRYVNNTVVGYTGIIIDNTERKKYIEALESEKKKAEESDKLKTAFLANMSHEIRTPMNSIIGFTNLLSRSKRLDKEQEEYVRYINQSGDLLLNLIDDIIDFAKIEAGELAIRQQDCNLNRMMEDLKARFSQVIKDKGNGNINLVLYKGISSPDFIISTDPHRLNQILSNLLSNASKFTEKGIIEFGYEVNPPSRIIYYVKDTGIGISKKDQKIIFERFRQVDGSMMRKYGGTGLGLSITRHLVELMGGKIKLESEPEKGSSFLIELPLIAGKNIVLEDSEIPEEINDNQSWAGKTVLIAEDNSTNYSFLREVLLPTGVDIIHVLNGRDAVSMVQARPEVELVLMDMQMPVLNGYDATRQIKKIRPDLPVIAQTAYALAGERENALASGCDDYISKPININILKSKISFFFLQSSISIDGIRKNAV